MTPSELRTLKKIRKNFASYGVLYSGVSPNKRDEAFRLLDQLIKDGVNQTSKSEFNRGYQAALEAARTAVEAFKRNLEEWKVPPLAWKDDE